MKRKVDYTWRLGELMAARGLHNTTDLSRSRHHHRGPARAEGGLVLMGVPSTPWRAG